MPEGIFAFKTAFFGYDIGAFLQGRLSGVDGDIDEMQMSGGEKRTFATEFTVAYNFHSNNSLRRMAGV